MCKELSGTIWKKYKTDAILFFVLGQNSFCKPVPHSWWDPGSSISSFMTDLPGIWSTGILCCWSLLPAAAAAAAAISVTVRPLGNWNLFSPLLLLAFLLLSLLLRTSWLALRGRLAPLVVGVDTVDDPGLAGTDLFGGCYAKSKKWHFRPSTKQPFFWTFRKKLKSKKHSNKFSKNSIICQLKTQIASSTAQICPNLNF